MDGLNGASVSHMEMVTLELCMKATMVCNFLKKITELFPEGLKSGLATDRVFFLCVNFM